MTVLIAILGLAFLVLIHEAGHFFVARAVGMRPRRFYLGFPPALLKTTRNGIEYGIGSIPLGGYVKIPGMHRPAPSDLDLHFGKALEEAPELVGPLDRIRRPLERGDMEAAQAGLGEVRGTLAAAQLSRGAAKAAERGLSELDDGFSGDAYWRARTWKRVAVIFAGPGTNILATIALLTAVYMLGFPTSATRAVGSVDPGSPAAAAGLQAGDRVLAVSGHPTGSFVQVSKRIRASHGRPITITVERGGSRRTLGPKRTKLIQGHYALGFVPRVLYRSYGPAPAFAHAARDTWRGTKTVAVFIPHLFRSSERKQVSGVVGIVQVSSQAAGEGARDYLAILALISLSLALLNLLPLLPLDGGHIVFSLIEGLRGRSVGRAVYERASALGIAVILLLMFVGLSNDIGRLGGG